MLQVLTVQAELKQAAVPLAATQVVPQVPQFEASLVVVASQPLATLPSQLPKPGVQAIVHTPPEQAGVPCVLLQEAGLAVVEQRPQLATLLLTSASHPLLARPSQSWKLPLQEVIVQAPATQAPTALAGAHADPHA